MPHYQPQAPKQRNYTDCGLFLLEYVEAFLRDPDFMLNNLHQKEAKLFRTVLVDDKRDIIKRLVTTLAEGETNQEERQ